MLRIGLRALAERPVETEAVVEPDDPLLDDLGFELREPLVVRGRLMESGPERYYWSGRLQTEVATICRRCLAPVTVSVAAEVQAIFTAEDSADDPAAYQIQSGAAELALDEMVREELLLAVPEYVLCREDCRGLCATCGKELNEGPCSCEPEPDPRWSELRALRNGDSQDER
ncbi:MAG: DUF177 domain-containing protein [Gemmatimonadales bacterium]|jgi:uncharacterized protein